MGSKLTIHTKTKTEENGWFNSFQYTNNIIDDIVDPAGGNIDKLLTAIPTPFAKMHLFETAFSLVIKSIRTKSLSESDSNLRAFNKMISDCFDLFELLFNFNILKNSGVNLKVKLWDFEQHIDRLLNSNSPQHKSLGDVLSKYYRANERLKENKKIYIFFYENEVLGATSPFTGVFTNSDLHNFSLKKTNGKTYFDKDSIPLWKRDEDFLTAIYLLFNSKKNPKLVSSAKKVYEYLELALQFIENELLRNKLTNIFNNIDIDNLPEFYEIVDNSNTPIKVLDAIIYTQAVPEYKDYNSPLKIKNTKELPSYCKRIPLALNENKDSLNEYKPNLKIPRKVGSIQEIEKRTLPDNKLRYPFLVVDDFLEDYLIKLKYPINSDSFFVSNLSNFKEDDNGVLLPIKKEYLDFFDTKDLKEYLNITKRENGDYLVELQIPVEGSNPVLFRKYYRKNKPEREDEGQIVDVDCYFAFFPLIKVKNDSRYNNFYKIMMVDAEFNHQNLSLKIFNEKNIEIKDNPNAPEFYKKIIRNEKTSVSEGTIYFQTNFPFNFLELNIENKFISQQIIKGLIVPRWKEINIGNRSFNVAIDFGTTNSYVVLLENNSRSLPISLTVGENELQTICLNKPQKDPNLSLTEQYESWNSELERKFFSRIKHEFVPSIIGEGSNPTYSFPIRTAISTSKNYTSDNSNLLGNVNISFIFEKDVIRDDEEIYTNLKWDITDGANETLIKEFIKELLYLVRNKILLNQGNPSETNIIWFKPLSMFQGHQEYYRRIWDDLFKEIFLKNKEQSTYCLTESCAPYFYYTAQNRALSSKPILVIDIGGGSTDVSFFLDGKPIFGTSFNFAGNAIWNPGLEKRHKTLEGIFAKYGDDFFSNFVKSSSESNKKLIEKFQEIYKSQSVKEGQSGNIFNLYFTWDHLLGFTNELRRDPIIKFLILFHFSSIIYHCASLLKNKGYDKPEFICVSGRGSRYLTILDPSNDLRIINGFINSFVEDIFDKKFNYSVKIEKVKDEKEATSIGGLYLLEESKRTGEFKDTSSTEPYYGEIEPKFKFINYNNIDENLKNSVIQNVHNFLDLFFKQNEKFNFNQRLTITLPKTLEEINDDLKSKSLHFLEIGLQKRSKFVKPNDQVNEPLFFYPLISMIYELNKFYDDENNN